MDQGKLDELKNLLSGEVILPADAGYEGLRGSFVRVGSPAIIVRCKDKADVAAAIRFAHDQGLALSVRSGGHSMSGLSTNDGGLVIDLSYFNAVEVLDASRNLVRIGAGARWGEAAQALAEHGLAISSGDTNTVGVGGLTLGGGIGWMVRKHGLSIDSLEAAEVVLADGRVVRVSESAHPELFWAIRGGGGNFGVVTSFDFRAQPVGNVFGGMVMYGIAEMEQVLRRWAAYMRTAPEELSSTLVIFPGFGTQPPPMVMVLLCYAGDDDALSEQVIQPLRELGTPLNQAIEKKPYYKMLEDANPPPGLKSAAQNGFVKALDGDVIQALVANFGQPGTPIVQLRSLGGAMARVSEESTAFAHRNYEAFLLSAALVPLSTSVEETERIRRESWLPLQPFVAGAYVNFLTDVGETSIAASYPAATYARLAAIKAEFDPENIFNQNANIKPA